MSEPNPMLPSNAGADEMTRPAMVLDDCGRAERLYRRPRSRQHESTSQLLAAAAGATLLVGAGAWLSQPSNARQTWQWTARLGKRIRKSMQSAKQFRLHPSPRIDTASDKPTNSAARFRNAETITNRAQASVWAGALLPRLTSLACALAVGMIRTRSASRTRSPRFRGGATPVVMPQVAHTTVAASGMHGSAAEMRDRRRASRTPQSKSWWSLVKVVFTSWSADKAPRLGAALAYYAVFSLAPLLVISLAVASFVFGESAAHNQLHGQLQTFLGDQGAEAVESLLAAAHTPDSGVLATVLGIFALLFGASGVFGELQDSLNTIWNVEPGPGRGIWTILRTRFLSFGMVLAVAFLLLISLVVNATLAALTAAVGDLIPGPDSLAWILNLVVSLATITGLFALIFKFLPDAEIQWRDVWLGAFVTAVLFTIGKYLIGLYLGQASIGSAYGAAGSVVIVLLWTYYSAQIMFLGAEFAQAYALRRGAPVRPKPYARTIGTADTLPSGP